MDLASPGSQDSEAGRRSWRARQRVIPGLSGLKPARRKWTIEPKAQVLAETSKLTGQQLSAYLERAGVKLADFERWRLALEQDGTESAATTRLIRKLERELARKEKGLAESAALLVLKNSLGAMQGF
jgi:hypothetical protein